MEVGFELWLMRHRARVNQAELAEEIGVCQSQVSRIENGLVTLTRNQEIRFRKAVVSLAKNGVAHVYRR